MAEATHSSSPPAPGPLSRRISKAAAQVLALLLVVVITTADYLTDPYLAFSTFYLIPVAIMAWYSTRVRALIFSVLVTVAGIGARALDPGEIRLSIIVTNGLLRQALFVFAVLLVEAERTARNHVAKLSTTDPLTGMLNRRAFTELGRDHLLQAARRGTPVTLVYTDLDDLKTRNDEQGHEAGDRMITGFADAMIATFRETDLVTRIGGDEFCCLLADTDEAEADAVLTRFESVLSQVGPQPAHASMGAVTTVPTTRTSISDLIHEADVLMYEAKLAGKGQHRTRTLHRPEADLDAGTDGG
ncbi:MAG TPA: GGDEF domain-containing protein [Acidimicrobiales bacterium]|nr:GGDEF domain-containing protein [Acidimicrobiales bacterium]